MRKLIVPTLLTCVLSLGATAPSHADEDPQAFLEKALQWLRNRDHNPAIAGLVQVGGRVEAEAAVGVRALNWPEAVTVDDRWHIGSDTKAFTATLIGTLVDRHTMTFDDTLETSLPMLTKAMNPSYRHVTIRQLLSHTAVLPPLSNTETDFPAAFTAVKLAHGAAAQRLALAKYYLSMPPAHPVGTFTYSNLGYVIVAAIAEIHTGQTWERLMRERVFFPLGITHAGFGPPGDPDKHDEPLGHYEESGKLVQLNPLEPDINSPEWLGPADRINISLKDWALFAQDQIDGARGHGKLLNQATYRTLQTPISDKYALGWGVALNADGSPKFLTHEGSNGYWFSQIIIFPKEDTILLTVTNFGGPAAQKSVEDLGTGLARELKLPLN
jgi:CubicO group peptidase (beta-lactamase class C family)